MISYKLTTAAVDFKSSGQHSSAKNLRIDPPSISIQEQSKFTNMLLSPWNPRLLQHFVWSAKSESLRLPQDVPPSGVGSCCEQYKFKHCEYASRRGMVLPIAEVHRGWLHVKQTRIILNHPKDAAHYLHEVIPLRQIHTKTERNQVRIICIWLSISLRLHYKWCDFTGADLINGNLMIKRTRRFFHCHCLASPLQWCLHSCFQSVVKNGVYPFLERRGRERERALI